MTTLTAAEYFSARGTWGYMVLHAYRNKIPLSPSVAWSLVGLQIAVHTTPFGAVTLPFMAGYGALVLAHQQSIPSRPLAFAHR